MDPLRRFLIASGHDAGAVDILEFSDIWGCNHEHAREIAVAVDRVRERTGVDRIDIVAHSMGGLATRRYMARGSTPVRRAIFIGTPHRGTWLAWLAWGEGGRQMRPGSDFLRQLASAPIPDDVDAFTIRTQLETRIFPGRNAMLEGVPDFRVRFSTHPGMLRNRAVLRRVAELLD